MLALRRPPTLVAFLAIALVAGPVASAACAHAGAADRTVEQDAPTPQDAVEAPCHGGPESPPPVQQEGRGCITLCCASEAPGARPSVPAPSAPDPGVPVDVFGAVDAPARPVDTVMPDASPPPWAPRLYVAYGQLLI